MMKKTKHIAGILLSAMLFTTGFAVTMTPVIAQAQDDDERPKRSQTLDPNVAKALGEIYVHMQAEEFQIALTKLNQLMASRGERMKPFDKATTLELRGSTKVSFEDYRGALRDFQDAVNTGGLPANRINNLRFYIAQLNFQLEDYQSAIRGLNEWIRISEAAGTAVPADAYYLLAAANTQITPPNYRAAVRPAEQAVAARSTPKKSDHDLLNLTYSETKEATKRGALLEKMVGIWPGERSYWVQLSGLYNNAGRDKEAFAVIEVAYRAGLLDKENDVLQLVQYYSFFDNPYRGAKLLEREMAAGTVKRTQDNMTLLSQLWSQSREHKRAIPVLRQAAGSSPDGELYYRLGQVLLADEQYKSSETALTNAINKGGLNSKKLGDAWMLLGTARFSQAGPGDRAVRSNARKAFVNAQRYPTARTQAGQWVAYIDAIIATEKAQDRLEKQQRMEALQDEIKRLRTQAQVCRLRGGSTGECDAILENMEEVQAQLKALIEGDGSPAEPAESDDAGGEAADDASADEGEGAADAG